MASTNVEFYEKMKELQEKQHESERTRLELEQQMNSYVKSDNRVAKLKAMRLQNYWKKICDDEKRSQWRNEQLLKDFDRVESHMETLSEKTERLKVMKKQYEDYIERTYPNWKEKVMQYHKLKQRAEKERQMKQIQEQAQAQRQATAAATAAAAGMGSVPNAGADIGGYLNLPDLQQQYRISSTLPNIHQSLPTPGYTAGMDANYGNQGMYQTLQPTQPQQPTGPSVQFSVPGSQPGMSAATPLHNQGMEQRGRSPLPPPSAQSTMHTVSSLPSGAEGVPRGPSPGVVVPSQMYEDEDSGEEVVEEPIAPRKAPTPREPKSPDKIQPSSQPTVEEEGKVTESISDFGSGDELPLSDRQENGAVKPVPTPRSARGSISENKPPEQPTSPPPGHSSLYARPDVTLHGLFNLLGAVENELPNAFSPEEYYRTNEPAKSVKKEILSNAERGASLGHVEGTSISMVVLEQIQLNVLNSESGYMIPDDILFRPQAYPTEEYISEHVDAPITGFWEKLYDHFKMLLKHDIMDAQAIGDIFGPLLISADCPYENNVKTLLRNLMENVSPEELMKSPQSTDTFSTIPSPRKRESLKKKAEQQKKQDDEEDNSRPTNSMESMSETFPPLDLGSDREEEPPPTALQLPPPATTTMPDLSQTAAYRQLLGETKSSIRTISYEESDDSDSDDIEGQIGSALSPRKPEPNPSKPDSAPATKKEPVQVPTETEADDDASTHSLGDTGGYVPSMGGTGKSGKSVTGSLSLGSSAKNTKNPAFRYGDSDTDEEVEIPGTGASDNKDDKEGDDFFDFYE